MDPEEPDTEPEIAPELRHVTQWLTAHHFEVLIAQGSEGCDCDECEPYIFIASDPEGLITDTARLHGLLLEYDAKMFETTKSPEGISCDASISIQGRYHPADDICMIDLSGPALVTSWGRKLVS